MIYNTIMERTKEDILQVKVTIIPNSNGIVYSNGSASYTQLSVTLKNALVDIPNKYRQTLEAISNMEYHSEEQCRAKACVPRYYIAGTFPVPKHNGQFTIKDSNIINPTNLMAVDIDKKDNESVDINKLREFVQSLPYVFTTQMSVSGQGFYAIICIADTNKTKSYYKSISQTWKSLYGINIDNSACNIARARIISYNPDAESWFKDNVSVWTKEYIEPTVKAEQVSIFNHKNIDDDFMIERTHKALRYCAENGYYAKTYNEWYWLACDCSNFNDGEDIFIRFSDNYPDKKDSIDKILKKYRGATPTGINSSLHRKWQGLAKKINPNWWRLKD